MININLLPPEIKLKISQTKKSANIFSICLVIFILVGFLGFGFISLKSYLKWSLESQRLAVDQKAKELSGYQTMEEQAVFINDRAKLTATLEEKRAIWSQIIQDLINSVPQEVKFASLSVNLERTPNFTLEGNANSEREIIKFKEKLEDSVFFKNVAFKSSTAQDQKEGEQPQLNFSLEFDLEQTSLSANPAQKDIK